MGIESGTLAVNSFDLITSSEVSEVVQKIKKV